MTAEAGEETIVTGGGAGEVHQIKERSPPQRGATDFETPRPLPCEERRDEPGTPTEEAMRSTERIGGRTETPVVRSPTARGVVGARVFEEGGGPTRIMTA